MVTTYSQKVITGQVVDQKGLGLPGVTIIARGTNIATLSDLDGNYTIKLPEEVKELEFSMIGMKTEIVPITSNVINVVMKEQEQEIGDVIVIGYGVQKKSDKTGSVAQVGNDEMDKGVITDPIQALQGKVAGVVITKRGGDPNAGFSVKVRGSAGLITGTEPLYVVDGVPGVDPTTIAPEDIESFNVLKDASSTAIYGSRGANGVIIITTKRGQKQVSNFEINSYVSFDQVAKRLDLLTADDIRKYVKDNNISFVDNGANTDWQDVMYRTGISQSHNIAFSGGDRKTNYRASFSALDFQGVIKGTQKTRYIGRMNFQHSALNEKLIVQANMAGTIEDNDYINYSGWGKNSVIYQTIRRNPTDPVYNSDGTFYESNRIFQYANPLALVEQILNQRKAKRFLGNFRVDLTIIEGLTAGLNLGYTRNDENSFYYEPTYALGGDSEGYGRISNSNFESKVLESTLTYNKTFSRHNLNSVLGYSFQEDVYWGNSQQGKNPSSDIIGINNMVQFMKVAPGDISSYKGSNRLISFFGRVVYNFDSKYYLTVTVRRDGSSKFGANNKWGWFPSGSVAWNIKRDLLGGVDFISDLKLRIGYGLAGNQEIENYIGIMTMRPDGVAPDPETGQNAVVWRASHNANPNLKWEENKELNVGLDYALAKNRFSGSIEFYDKVTYNLLAEYSVPVPPYPVSRIFANVGSIRNRGFEFNLQAYVVDVKNLRWKTILNFSTNKQKVLKLSSGEFKWELMKLGWAEGQGLVGQENYTQVLGDGYDLGTFYLPHYVGLNEDGDFLFLTEAGGVTSKIQYATRIIAGSAQPKFTIGWSNYFDIFKNIDLSVSWRVIYGHKIFNNTRLIFENPSFLPDQNALRSALKEKERGLKSAPVISDYYLEDGSFARLDNLVLGYTFNTKKSTWLRKFRVYFSGTNLLTITKYTGIDPEITFTGLSFGVEKFDVYPKVRSYTLGLNITF